MVRIFRHSPPPKTPITRLPSVWALAGPKIELFPRTLDCGGELAKLFLVISLCIHYMHFYVASFRIIDHPSEQSSSTRVCGPKSHCSRLPRPPDLLQTYMVPSDHCRGRLLGPERSPRTLRGPPSIGHNFGGGGWVGDTPRVVRTGNTLRLPSCPPHIACLYIYVFCRMCVMSRLCEEQKVVSVRSLYVCLIVCLTLQVSTTRQCREQRDWHRRKFSTPNSMHIYSHTHIFHSGFFFGLSNRTTLLRQLHQEAL